MRLWLSNVARQGWEDHANDEHGFMLALMALALTTFLGVAGFSVDLGNWYVHIQRTQQAADSAALSGAVYLPGDLTTAKVRAREALTRNGVPQDQVDAAVIAPVTNHPSELSVQVKTVVPNAFVQLVGAPHTSTFSRKGTALWRPKLGAGRFANVLGQEPSAFPSWEPAAKKSRRGDFWLNIGGGNGWKVRGEQMGVAHCKSSGPHSYSVTNGPSGCSGDTNLDYTADPDGVHTGGYQYAVDAPPGGAGTSIAMQAFDPAFAFQADACDSWSLEELYTTTRNSLHVTGQTDSCTGDENYEDTANVQPTTTFQVIDPKTGVGVPGCPPRIFRPYGGISGSLKSWRNDATFQSVFRKWVDLCTAPYDPVKGSKYVIKVSTDKDSQGFNRFSLRAGYAKTGTVLPSSAQSGLAIYSQSAFPLWANFDGSDTRVAMTLVPPNYAGTDVSVNFFDMGDADKAANFSLQSSAKRTSGGSTTTACDVKGPTTTSFSTLPSCTLTNVKDDFDYDGHSVTIRWHVPSDYTCSPGSTDPSLDCYLFVRAQYPIGAKVNDATTWSVMGDGAPLRLVTDN